MSTLIDLGYALTGDRPEAVDHDFDWHQLAALWDANDMMAAHHWLTVRWSRIVRTRIEGHRDPDARFLQGLAFAANTLFFTQSANQEGALMMLDDALMTLAPFKPEFLGLRVEPVLATLNELRPLIVSIGPYDECPMQPLVYRRLEITDSPRCLMN